MNNQELYQGISHISASHVEEAERPLRRSPKRFWKPLTALAACLVLIMGVTFWLNGVTQARVYLTINPSVVMTVNRLGNVKSVEALNEDGTALLAGHSYTGKELEKAAKELVELAEKAGYLDQNGQVTLAVEAEQEAARSKYCQELSEIQFGEYQLSIRQLISEKTAKQLALANYGLNSATFTDISCDAGHEQTVYTLKFQANGTDYTCRLDGATGQVLPQTEGEQPQLTQPTLPTEPDVPQESVPPTESDVPQESTPPQETQGTEVSPEIAPPANGATYTEDEVKNLALSYAGITGDALTQVTFTKIELDTEERRPVYELEFDTVDASYEYAINGLTGELLKEEYELRSNAWETSGTEITAEDAKAIALADAGFTEDQVVQLKVEQDMDDGILIYEVKFNLSNGQHHTDSQHHTDQHHTSWHYDYDIAGISGQILKKDMELDD